MALYDNKYWLLSHIRNSFISTDDTGMCELVMVGESKDVKQHLKCAEPYPEPDESEDEEDDFESYEMQMEMDFNIRDRSNTVSHIEKIELARKKASKIRHIKWEKSENVNNDDMFVKKDISQSTESKKQGSMLTTLLNSHSEVPKNPYMEFAKFDGSGQVNIPTKKYKIFLTMLPPQQRNYPIHICCIASAKVLELIGLTLLKYSHNHGISNLKAAARYGLYITEEDGEVDRDFPCLDPKEPISKFGFTCLGLVEHSDITKSVSFPEESQNSSNENLGRTRLISEKAKVEETKQMENDMQAVEEHNKLMEAPLYRSFEAVMINKVKPRVEVNIGVSGERIEIDPVPQKGAKLLPFKLKAISHSIDSIASCEVTDIKADKSYFRIVYSTTNSGYPTGQRESSSSASSNSPSIQNSSNFKHYDFESDHSTTKHIVKKLKLILDLKSSFLRNEYLSSKEKKSNRRKNFNIMK
ncbi:SAPK-interacting protein 1 isoform X1 [Leptinotarsa decemlineata]|uniref:SAPK-interacting protein 1 isoform X1 n=1 Tax=Leptinotarsa decemlineata TaxID=7539 RepID=UPI003D30A9CA